MRRKWMKALHNTSQHQSFHPTVDAHEALSAHQFADLALNFVQPLVVDVPLGKAEIDELDFVAAKRQHEVLRLDVTWAFEHSTDFR